MALRLEIPSLNHIPTDSMTESDQLSSATENNRRFRQNFEDAMPSSRKPKRYESVGVLMLSFDPKCTIGGKEVMDVSEEIERLAIVFRDQYNFHVATEVMRSDFDAQAEALKYLSDFRLEQSQKRNTLTIFYYAGHGWRSLNKQRKKKGGFDLAPSRIEAELQQRKGSFVMWEAAERVLHDMQGDVLVIFDCCDSGYLDGRGSAYTFDYLAACGDHKTTWVPGKHSFTSALIWALKELGPDESELTVSSKRKTPFKVQQLRDKIKEHEHFPEDQQPRLFSRFSDVTEPIWLAPIEKAITPTTPEIISICRRRSSGAKPDSRPEERSYVDLRFFFKEEITYNDADKVARMVRSTVQNQNLDLNANHVSALGFGSTATARKRFKRAFHSILAANSFSKVSPQAKDKEPEESDSPVRKRAKIGPQSKENDAQHGPGSLRASKCPVTPVSDETQSDAEAHVTVHVESGATASVDVHLTTSGAVTSDAVGIHIIPKSE